jgi:hypothetical protein
LAVIYKEKKYKFTVLAGLIIAIILLASQSFLPAVKGLITRVSNFIGFGVPDFSHWNNLVDYPFGSGIALVILSLMAFILLILSKRGPFLFIFYTYLTVVLILTSFTFIIDTKLFTLTRYISFLFPFYIILASFFLLSLYKLFTNRVIRTISVSALVLFLIFPGHPNITDTYIGNIYSQEQSNPDFRSAYSTIVENYDHEDDILLTLFLRDYYLEGLNTTAVYSITYRKGYYLEDLEVDLTRSPSSWVTWETRKESFHMRSDVVNYIHEHCTQYHGEGIDNTSVEVFYCEGCTFD